MFGFDTLQQLEKEPNSTSTTFSMISSLLDQARQSINHLELRTRLSILFHVYANIPLLPGLV